jgi:hypothetical protein
MRVLCSMAHADLRAAARWTTRRFRRWLRDGTPIVEG